MSLMSTNNMTVYTYRCPKCGITNHVSRDDLFDPYGNSQYTCTYCKQHTIDLKLIKEGYLNICKEKLEQSHT